MTLALRPYLSIAVFVVVLMPSQARAAAAFTFKNVDSTGSHMFAGALCADGAGNLVATDFPAGRAPYTDPPAHRPLRISSWRAGHWTLHAPPPVDSAGLHDLAVDATGGLHLVTWRNVGTEYFRPILEEEVADAWQITELDTGFVANMAIQLDAQGQPWVAMYRALRTFASPINGITFAHRTAAGWERFSISLPDIGATAFAWDHALPFSLDPSGVPHLLLGAASGTGILTLSLGASGWAVETLDAAACWSCANSIPPAPLAFSSTGVAHALYGASGALWHAQSTAAGWQRELVDGSVRGNACALALDHADRLFAVYPTHLYELPWPVGAVNFAVRGDAGWSATPVHDDSLINFRFGLLFDAANQPLLYLVDPATGNPMLGMTTETASVPPSAAHRFSFALASRDPARQGEPVSWRIDLPTPAEVVLEAFDIAGRLLAASLPRRLPAGSHTVAWSPAVAGPGSYFVSARIAGQRSEALHWILVR